MTFIYTLFHLLIKLVALPPESTLFPYTTLFRANCSMMNPSPLPGPSRTRRSPGAGPSQTRPAMRAGTCGRSPTAWSGSSLTTATPATKKRWPRTYAATCSTRSRSARTCSTNSTPKGTDMTQPTPNIRVNVVTITPQLAEQLLGKNPNNRKISRTNYNTVRRAIEHGEWELNGEAIKLSQDGTVLDGQHRLMAVRDTGISIQSLLIEGL